MNGKTYVVGVAGGSASGKSTFAGELIAALGAGDPPLRCHVLSMDRYFYRGAPGGPRIVSPSTGKEMPDNNHPDSADNVKLCLDLDELVAAEDAPDILIVEGLMALCLPMLRERMDLRLFIELDADQRALRRLLRDMSGQRGTSDPQAIARYYNECARVGHAKYVEPSRVYADLIVRGDGDFKRTSFMVASMIRSMSPIS